MPLILAIEPDRRQSTQLTTIVRGRLHADLVLRESAEGALAALGDRVPDLILTSALLSPKDEHTLGELLRSLNSAVQVQTLTIPVLGSGRPRSPITRGLLSALRRDADDPPLLDGCDPAVFAEQCVEYLNRAAAERAARAPVEDDERESVSPAPPVDPPLIQSLSPFDLAQGDRELVERSKDDDLVDDHAGMSALEEFEIVAVDEPLECRSAEHAATTCEEAPFIEYDLSAIIDILSMYEPEPAAEEEVAIELEPVEPAAVLSVSLPAIPAMLGPRALWPPIEGTVAEDSVLAEFATFDTPAITRRLPRAGQPFQDEWGFFDPEQCGLAAMNARLDEIIPNEC